MTDFHTKDAVDIIVGVVALLSQIITLNGILGVAGLIWYAIRFYEYFKRGRLGKES